MCHIIPREGIVVSRSPPRGGGVIVVSQNSPREAAGVIVVSQNSSPSPWGGGCLSELSSPRGGCYCCPSELPPQGRTLRTPPCTLYIGYTLYTLYTSYTLYTLYTLYITHTRGKGKPAAPKRKRAARLKPPALSKRFPSSSDLRIRALQAQSGTLPPNPLPFKVKATRPQNVHW